MRRSVEGRSPTAPRAGAAGARRTGRELLAGRGRGRGTRGLALLVAGALALGAAGCGGDEPSSGGAAGAAGGAGAGAGAGAASETRKVERTPVDPATAGSIRGVVRVEGSVSAPGTIRPSADAFCINQPGGTLPDRSLLVADGKLENAFVWVASGLDGYAFPEPEGAVAFDQENCLFKQRVVGVRAGQEIELHNSDPVLHNVNFKGRSNKAVNYAIPAGGDPRTTSMKREEIAVPVVCDVHPWMYASIAVVDHPCFAVSDAAGAFTIEGVPPGTYTLRAWHETLGTREVQVTVEPSGAAAAPDLVFSAR